MFPEFGTSGKQVITKYEHTPKGLKLAGELQIVPNSYPVNLTQVSADKAYVPMYNLGKVMVVNTSTFTKVGEIDLTQYAHKDNSAEPSYGIVRDGLYFLPLDQVGTNWMPYDDHRQVDIAVIDIKTDKLLQVISEKESGLCMPTRPFLKDMIFTDENNDIYVTCIGYFGYSPLDIKNGFVCIPSGKLEFDDVFSIATSSTNCRFSDILTNLIYCGLFYNNQPDKPPICQSNTLSGLCE